MKLFKSFWLIVILMLAFTVSAYAGVFDTVKSWFGDQLLGIIALLLTGLLGIANKMLGAKQDLIVKTMKETGNLIEGIGDGIERMGGAIQDGKIETQELQNGINQVKQVKADVKSVVDIYKHTPIDYQVK